MSRNVISRTERRLLILERNDRANDKLAIFVHGYQIADIGLFGKPETGAWGNLKDLLHAHADDEQPFSEWDYGFVGYQTSSIGTYLDIADIIATVWAEASQGEKPFSHEYRRLALFGHSLGTLGIRQLLCARSVHPPRLLDALQSVTLFAGPANGSWLAYIAQTKVAAALVPGNPQLKMLQTWTESVHDLAPWPKVRNLGGLIDPVVNSELWDRIKWVGDVSRTKRTNQGHISINKLWSWESGSTVKDAISSALRARGVVA